MNSYGLLVTLGIIAGTYAASKVKREAWDVLPWVVIPGVIGARLYHVVDWWWYYQDHLGLILAVWTGGLGIYGGIAGGFLGLWWYCRQHQEKFTDWLNAAAVGLPLGQAIGRWGNYFNQELYGRATSLPWGIYIAAENNYFHPLFLYESAWNLLVFGVVWRLRRQPNLFVIYVGLYSLGRFGLEWLRLETWLVNKLVSLSLVVLSLLWLWKRNRKNLSFS